MDMDLGGQTSEAIPVCYITGDGRQDKNKDHMIQKSSEGRQDQDTTETLDVLVARKAREIAGHYALKRRVQAACRSKSFAQFKQA